MAEDHLLSAAGRMWSDIRAELQDRAEEGDLADGAVVPPEELRNAAKWFQHAVTNFGASAAVAEGPHDPALQVIAEELIKAFAAAIGTLLSLRRGAGLCLREELRVVGGGLAEATNQLGASVGTPDMTVAAGKALDCAKHLERISVHNRAATRRRILMSLGQIRDANRELSEALQRGQPGAAVETEEHGEEDEDLDLGDSDQEELEPHERRLVEAIYAATSLLEEALKQASSACMPPSSSGDGSASPAPGAPVAELEVLAASAAAAARSVDSLATSAVGGLDAAEFGNSLAELRGAAACASAIPDTAAELAAALDGVQAALDAVPTEEKGS